MMSLFFSVSYFACVSISFFNFFVFLFSSSFFFYLWALFVKRTICNVQPQPGKMYTERFALIYLFIHRFLFCWFFFSFIRQLILMHRLCANYKSMIKINANFPLIFRQFSTWIAYVLHGRFLLSLKRNGMSAQFWIRDFETPRNV